MKKTIAILVILALVFTMGCAGKDTNLTNSVQAKAKNTAEDTSSTSITATNTASTDTTSAAVSEIESDLTNIENFDSDLLSTELEDLDTELDFEI